MATNKNGTTTLKTSGTVIEIYKEDDDNFMDIIRTNNTGLSGWIDTVITLHEHDAIATALRIVEWAKQNGKAL